MKTNIEKADAAMKKMNSIKGVYCKPIKTMCSSIKHMAKADIYRIIIDIDAKQLGGDKCVGQVLECGERLKMIPILAFIDPKEVN